MGRTSCDGANAKELADLAVRRGKRAVAKFYIEVVTKALKPGWISVLSRKFPRFPSLESGRSGVDEILAFLTDAETKRKRTRLFNWHDGIEAAVRNGEFQFDGLWEGLAAPFEEYAA